MQTKTEIVLSKALNNPKNISALFNAICKHPENDRDMILYHVMLDINKKVPLKNIVIKIRSSQYTKNNPCFDQIKKEIAEQDDFINNPFEVVEGALECAKCGSKRVYSYQKQTRSCDEPSTTFASCLNCSKKWIYNG